MGTTSNFCILLGVILVLIAPSKQADGDPVNDPQNIVYLLDRLYESIFMPKGVNRDVIFNVPTDYVPLKYRDLAAGIFKRNDLPNVTHINVPNVTIPDLSRAMRLNRTVQFSPFIASHRDMAHNLLENLLLPESYPEFLAIAVYARINVNIYMFVYVLYVAIQNRPDTRHVKLPLHVQILPEKYFKIEMFGIIKATLDVRGMGNTEPIPIPREFTATNLQPEHRVAYFREDIGLNLAHWQWHVEYPHLGPIQVVNQSRRGELFYYFHEQILARYNFERFSNQLNRVTRFINWRDPIEEAYFPHLTSRIASMVWPGRQAQSILQNIDRSDTRMDVQDMERYRDTLSVAIHTGRARDADGNVVLLNSETGIDILGNMVEASILSINPGLYGGLHNMGHNIIAFVHDPQNLNLEPGAVMGDITTACRDPVFYRWHSFINFLFQSHKKMLPTYTTKELEFKGVTVTNFYVKTEDDKTNQLGTFWQQSVLDLTEGVDFERNKPVTVEVTHLQYTHFNYHIQVHNKGNTRKAIVRIFMAPKFDERGLPLQLKDQVSLFIELDKFKITLTNGKNDIMRSSVDSSVTRPQGYLYSNPAASHVPNNDTKGDIYTCGWPQHLLIPKGNPMGLQADLFVMIDDRVDSAFKMDQPGNSYCGVKGHPYPDLRAMGFPFDRPPAPRATFLSHFLLPNMKAIDVTIVHNDTAIPVLAGNLGVIGETSPFLDSYFP